MPATTFRTPRAATALAAALAAAATIAAAPAAGAQTIGAPPDPALGYAGPFGSASAGGGRPLFAQLFRAPGAASLESFTFYLGDFSADRSGAGLRFTASVFTTTRGGTLGSRLYQSGVRSGSANYVGFDAYTFLTPGLALAPAVEPFAFVLEALGETAGPLNVLATSAADYADGRLLVIGPGGQFVPVNGAQDAAFTATFAAAVVPEPGTVLLVGVGVAGLAGVARRRRR